MRRHPKRRAAAHGHTRVRSCIVAIDGDTYAVLSWSALPAAKLPALTGAEREVLDHLLAGKSNAVIARLRRTSVRTVANQVASIFRKLGVSSRSELAALAGLS